MGLLSLKYRRPAKQPIGRTLPDDSQVESLDDQSWQTIPSYSSASIPEALTFDKIIEGSTCPPCTLRDFMNYLIYIEHSAENLQFYLWYRSYISRFEGADTVDLVLAPEWTQEMQNEAFAKLQKEHREGLKRDPASVAALFRGTDFEKKGNIGAPGILDRPSPIFSETGSNPFSTPPRTPHDGDVGSFGLGAGADAMNYRSQASEAFAAAGIKAPFTIQPFRGEIDRVIATYIMDAAPRQLNLSARERQQLLTALSRTTHPSALRQVARSVESGLRMQAHPNFIRWSVCNGNPPRVAFAKLLGAFLIAASLAAYVLLSLSRAPRGLRALPAASAVLGVATQCAALKGMCVVLHGMHHRHVRPWELFVDEEVEPGAGGGDEEEEDAGSEKEGEGEGGCGSSRSFEPFGAANSYEDEPWVVRYQKRNLLRKILDREVWIQEPALRSIQDTIFVQALLVGVVTAGALTALFVCLPGGNLF